MPELPEVDVITGVAARHSIDRLITQVEILRQPKNLAYFGEANSVKLIGRTVKSVFRRGKHVMFLLDDARFIECHNAMTGYWDWGHDPWTFDYVEGARSPDGDVRVRLTFDNGDVLRFHDLRFFGHLRITSSIPQLGPELMLTPNGMPDAPVIDLKTFAEGLWRETRTVKEVLMDQSFVTGIGNIYANEGCHVAAVDPRWPACSVPPRNVPLLLEALRGVVSRCMTTVKYGWLDVYRRTSCGTCGGSVERCLVAKRATFVCNTCQG